MTNCYKTISLLLLTLFFLVDAVTAQEDATSAVEIAGIPDDLFDRGTPRGSADGFLAAIERADYETASEYLDLRNLLGEAQELSAAELARRLSVVVRRATWVDIDELVHDPAGRSNDGLPAYRDSIGYVLDNGAEVQLLMQKVPRGDEVSIWKISNATVSLIPRLYATYGYPELIEELRRNLPNASFLGFELFKWVVVLGTGLFVYALVFLLALVVRWAVGNPEMASHKRIFRFIVLPIGLWLTIVIVNVVASSLGRGMATEALQRLTPLPILITVWVMYAGTNLLRDLYITRLQENERHGTAVLIRPLCNALKLLIAMGAVLVYLDKLGVNITTVLAGLGVGGIAVALALQKPLEDVLGAITLYTQQPIRVGDFCQIRDQAGTIEEIGLRTTRLRTLANTVIAIPNARLANEAIDNISARRKILYRPILRLRYDTTPEQLRQILSGIRELIGAHDSILEDGQRVRFKEIAEDALLIEVYAYFDTTEWVTYLELAEELNIRILEVVAATGTSLSLPARTLHIEDASSFRASSLTS